MGRLRASLAAAAGLTGAAALAGPAGAAKPVPKQCPPAAVIQATLKQKVTHLAQSSTSFTNGLGRDTARRTCTYTTAHGKKIDVILTAGAQVLGFVDAWDAAVEANSGYQNEKTATKHVVPVFGKGNDAWAVKEGGLLSALYKTDAIVIQAPGTTVAQLKALAQATLGIPSPTNV